MKSWKDFALTTFCTLIMPQLMTLFRCFDLYTSQLPQHTYKVPPLVTSIYNCSLVVSILTLFLPAVFQGSILCAGKYDSLSCMKSFDIWCHLMISVTLRTHWRKILRCLIINWERYSMMRSLYKFKHGHMCLSGTATLNTCMCPTGSKCVKHCIEVEAIICVPWIL